MQTIRPLLLAAVDELRAAGVPDPVLSTRFLIAWVMEIAPGEVMLKTDLAVSSEQEARLQDAIEQRKRLKPVAYITGTQYFAGLDLLVSPATLIPRPETEELIELVSLYIAEHPGDLRIIDIGTGSGAIALALAYRFGKRLSITGYDISEEALVIANQNKVKLSLNNVKFEQADLLLSASKADIIVANLPYIPSDRLSELAADVRDHEPRLALDGGPDGFDLYRRLFDQILLLAKPPKALFCEIDDTHRYLFLDEAGQRWPKSEVYVAEDLAQRTRFGVVKLSS